MNTEPPRPDWLDGRRALVVGLGKASDAVADTLNRKGAVVIRSDPGFVDAPEIAQAFERAELESGGQIDILVHAGTAITDAAPETIRLEAWRATQSADIDGRFLHAAEFVRRRLAAEAQGAILFLMPSAHMGPGRAAAATAHGALDNLVKSLAVEWARDGVRTNAIASRVTEKFDAATGDEQTSLGNLAAYLVSDYAAYVTGCVMGVEEG